MEEEKYEKKYGVRSGNIATTRSMSVILVFDTQEAAKNWIKDNIIDNENGSRLEDEEHFGAIFRNEYDSFGYDVIELDYIPE